MGWFTVSTARGLRDGWRVLVVTLVTLALVANGVAAAEGPGAATSSVPASTSSTPDASAPEDSTLDTTVPQSTIPETTAPSTTVPSTTTPDIPVAPPPPPPVEATGLEPGRYIVQLRDEVGDPAAFAAAIPGAADVHVLREIFNGFVAELDEAALSRLANDPMLISLEADRKIDPGPQPEVAIRASATQPSAPWGLDRIDQRGLPLSGTYEYTRTGAGVTAYIIDSGIRADHSEFGGRVASGFTAISDSYGTGDCSGHGTHVAGTVGGAISGVAKAVTLRPVRVFGCGREGYLADIISGIDWVIGHHVGSQPAVANLSFGGSTSSLLDSAVSALVADGVTAVVAAGNESMPACYSSPARLGVALTVAASTSFDSLASFSNYGGCVDLIAPGAEIRSAAHTGSSAFTIKSGTSMAAPHVAGAAALLLEATPSLTPAQVGERLLSAGTLGATGVSGSTPDLLLYVGSGPNQVPANDLFSAATVLPGSSTTVSGSNVGASKEAGEPNHAGRTGGRSVWWRFTAPSNGTLVVSTAGSSFDTLLGVYTGGFVSGLTQVAANDNSGGSTSQVTVTVTSGTVYSIAVDGNSAAAGTISLASTWTPAAVNDVFSAATVLPGSSTMVSGSNVGASKEAGEPNHAGRTGGRSVWWRFTAPSNGTLVVSTAGSSFDTLLGVYTGSSVSALTLVASNDDFTGSTSQVTVTVTSGTVYSIAVDGDSGESGTVSLSLMWPTPSPGNDVFSAATVLPGSSTTVSGSNVGASKEAGEPNHAGYSGGRSVWWRFTAPSNGTLVVSTAGSSFDTLLGVYTGSSVSALTLVASNDDFNGSTSQLTTSVTAGTAYSIAVDGYARGSGTIVLALTFIPVPANDAFSAAVALPGSSTTVSGSNVGASKEAGEPNHAGYSGGRSVWWRFTAPSNGTLVVSTAGSSFDTLLGVYTGSSVSALTENDSDIGFDAEGAQVVVSMTAGTVYSIAVDGFYNDSGSISLTLTWIPAPVNDMFSAATVLPTASTVVSGSNVAASRELGEPNHAGIQGNGSVWWRLTLPFSGAITVSTAGSSFDTLLAVYAGSQVASLIPIASNDDFADGTSRVTFWAAAGQAYSIAVDGFWGASGSISLRVEVPPQVPAAPAAVVASAGTAAVALSWSAPNNGGSPINDYVIQRSTNGQSWSTVSDGVNTNTSVWVTSLSNGRRYLFRIAARNQVGQGPWSATVESIPRTVPAAPSSLSATGRHGHVALRWSAPSSNGGSPVTDYVVQWSLDGRSWTTVSDGVSASTSTVVHGLFNGLSYRFRVAAMNVAGGSSFSSSRSATPRLALPSAPRSLRVNPGSGMALLTWSSPSSDGGSVVTDYVVQWSLDGRSWTTVSDTVSSSTSLMVGGLFNGFTYRFRVSAVNEAGAGPSSASISARPR